MSPILNIFLFIALVSAVPTIISPPTLHHCTTHLECPLNYCCLLGPTRYAIPSCTPFQQQDEQCRINAEAFTANLTYPDNSRIEINNISYILCPCADGLSCNPKNGICN